MSDNQLSLEDWLEELKGQRAALDVQIAGVLQRLGRPPEDGIPPTLPALDHGGGSHRIGQHEFFRMKNQDAIKKFLGIMKRPQTPKAIADGLKAGGVLSTAKNFYSNITTALKRLEDSGELVNNAQGWGLAEWWEGRAKDAGKGKGKKRKNGKKRRKAGQKPAEAAEVTKASAKPASGYNAFVAEQRKAGKTLKEIGAAWQKKKAEAS